MLLISKFFIPSRVDNNYVENTIGMGMSKSFVCFFAFAISLIAVSCDGSQKDNEEAKDAVNEMSVPEPKTEYGIVVDSFTIEEGSIKNGQVLSTVFINYGVSPATAFSLNLLPDSVFDVRKVRAGKGYTAYLSKDSIPRLQYFVYHNSLANHVVFDLRDSLSANKFDKPIRPERRFSEAEIETSLWNAISDNNLDYGLANELSDIYAWTVDFFGIQPGDGFKVLYDELYVDSISVGIGKIYAAIFTHNGQDIYAINFEDGETNGYWDLDGNSLRKSFLKAPLKFKRISSKFTYARRHPIYKTVRPHTGVDYAAPMGTPVVALGDGKVIERRYKGGGGNTVRIKHNSVYTTAYLHLSKFAKDIKVGSFVKQGQVIGYVGSTGASTGPHLDFRVWKNGTPIDPLTMESPSVAPIPDSLKGRFTNLRDSLLGVFNYQIALADSIASSDKQLTSAQ